MSHEDEKSSRPGVFFAVIFVYLFIWILTVDGCNGHWKAEAVKHGKAEYVADEDGYSQWQWKK